VAATVTIGAADLALGDLVRDRSQSMALHRQPHHGRPLWPDVVELEYADVLFPAVDTRKFFERLVREPEVSRDFRAKLTKSCAPCAVAPDPPGTTRGSSAMAVGADDFTFGNLLGQSADTRAEMPHLAHAAGLPAHMIELKNNELRNAAVPARVLR
jgi:hypothetical protein